MYNTCNDMSNTKFKPGDTVEVVSVEQNEVYVMIYRLYLRMIARKDDLVSTKDYSAASELRDFERGLADILDMFNVAIISDSTESVMSTIEQLRSDGIEWAVIKRAVQNVEDNEAEAAGVRDAERKIEGHYSA
jgi:hypothetical protein